MSEALVWAHYLQDEVISFRPPEESDADSSLEWHESVLPLTAAQVLESLKETETVPWDGGPMVRLIAGTIEDGTIVGGVKIEGHDQRVETLAITPARSLPLDQQRSMAVRMLGIVLPWLIGEGGVSSVILRLPDDHDHMIDAAGELGFQRVATYREHLLRPQGHIDQHIYQLMNPAWTLTRAEENPGE